MHFRAGPDRRLDGAVGGNGDRSGIQDRASASAVCRRATAVRASDHAAGSGIVDGEGFGLADRVLGPDFRAFFDVPAGAAVSRPFVCPGCARASSGGSSQRGLERLFAIRSSKRPVLRSSAGTGARFTLKPRMGWAFQGSRVHVGSRSCPLSWQGTWRHPIAASVRLPSFHPEGRAQYRSRR